MTTTYIKRLHQIPVLIAVMFLLGTTACQGTTKPEEDMFEKQNLTFLALGDSYTIGEGVSEFERWPVLLADTLREMGYEVESPLIIARTGWTTAELRSGIFEADPQGTYDIVSLLIGVNNQYRGISRGYTLEAYRREFEELLRMAVSFADDSPEKVIVLSIPDYGVTPFAANLDKERVSAEIDAYNAVNREIARETGVYYIDITPVSRLAAQDPELLAPHRLHPSGKMYNAWVELILQGIKKERK